MLSACSRWRQLGIGQPDDGLPRGHGRRRRRGPHARQLEPRQRDVAPAQREPPGAGLARRDEAPSPSARAAPQPSPSPHAGPPSAPAATAAPPRRLHAPVLLVPGRPQSRIAHVRLCTCYCTMLLFWTYWVAVLYGLIWRTPRYINITFLLKGKTDSVEMFSCLIRPMLEAWVWPGSSPSLLILFYPSAENLSMYPGVGDVLKGFQNGALCRRWFDRATAASNWKLNLWHLVILDYILLLYVAVSNTLVDLPSECYCGNPSKGIVE